MNNIIWIILDSCRYDTFIQADTPNFDRIGTVQKRYSYASWTLPAHFTFLMGLLPHSSDKKSLAANVYKSEFQAWRKRIGSNVKIQFEDILPQFNLVKLLNHIGYRTVARVSLPVLNPHTVISQYFDDYRLMDHHNSFNQIVDMIEFSPEKPSFYFLNLGETHYPYMLDDPQLPHISGLHGVMKDINLSDDTSVELTRFNKKILYKLRQQQIEAVSYCDRVFAKLVQKCTENTYVIITSDHGELFGEAGHFGHGPIMHTKVFEVPLIEGQIKIKSSL